MTVSSGVAMEIHYCMGEHAGADLYGSSDGKCGRCGMKEQNKSGCCHDDHQFYKLNDSHKKSVSEFNFETGEPALESSYVIYDWLLPATTTSAVIANHSPPLFSRPPARILHGVFRI